MTCKYVAMHGGGVAIVCSRGGRRPKRCVSCGHPSQRECDFILARSPRLKTCDAPLCLSCTTALPGDKDACPKHKRACLDAIARHAARNTAAVGAS